MEWVASTLHTTSEHDVSSITTNDAHTSAASSRLNWRLRRFKWTRPFRRKTKSVFRACAITFQTQSTNNVRVVLVHTVVQVITLVITLKENKQFQVSVTHNNISLFLSWRHVSANWPSSGHLYKPENKVCVVQKLHCVYFINKTYVVLSYWNAKPLMWK